MYSLNNEPPWWIACSGVEQRDSDNRAEWEYACQQPSSMRTWLTSSDQWQHPAYVSIVPREEFYGGDLELLLEMLRCGNVMIKGSPLR